MGPFQNHCETSDEFAEAISQFQQFVDPIMHALSSVSRHTLRTHPTVSAIAYAAMMTLYATADVLPANPGDSDAALIELGTAAGVAFFGFLRAMLDSQSFLAAITFLKTARDWDWTELDTHIVNLEGQG